MLLSCVVQARHACRGCIRAVGFYLRRESSGHAPLWFPALRLFHKVSSEREKCAEGHLVDTSLKCLSAMACRQPGASFPSGLMWGSFAALPTALGSSVLRGLLLSSPRSHHSGAGAPFCLSRGSDGGVEPAADLALMVPLSWRVALLKHSG